MGSWTNRANFLNIDFWRPNHTTATYPGTSYTNALGIPIILDRSFIRLKNLTLGYTFDKKIAEKIGIKNLRVYVVAPGGQTDPLQQSRKLGWKFAFKAIITNNNWLYTYYTSGLDSLAHA